MCNSIQEAFSRVCAESREAQVWYVCLMENRPFYGGAEEGGWWGWDSRCVAYQEFATHAEAEKAAFRVDELARELRREEKERFGRQCLREWEFCEERGLEADWLGEVDGEVEWDVLVCDRVPTTSYGEREWS